MFQSCDACKKEEVSNYTALDIYKFYLHLQQSKISIFYLDTDGTVEDFLHHLFIVICAFLSFCCMF